MKLLFAGTLAFANLTFFPKFPLLLVMAIAIVLDFATGVLKAYVKGEVRNSTGFRKTIVKFGQYAGAIIAGIILAATADSNAGEATKLLIHYINDGLVSFIIYIEITSVFENLNEVDKTTMFAKFFYQPALKVLTFEIKNSALNKASATIPTDPTDTATN